jgi:hypothetical protein
MINLENFPCLMRVCLSLCFVRNGPGKGWWLNKWLTDLVSETFNLSMLLILEPFLRHLHRMTKSFFTNALMEHTLLKTVKHTARKGEAANAPIVTAQTPDSIVFGYVKDFRLNVMAFLLICWH